MIGSCYDSGDRGTLISNGYNETVILQSLTLDTRSFSIVNDDTLCCDCGCALASDTH